MMNPLVIALAAGPFAFLVYFMIDKINDGRRNNRAIEEDIQQSSKDLLKGKKALINYNEYRLSMTEKLYSITIAAVSVYILGFVFYRSHVLSVALIPLALFYPRIRARDLMKKRKYELSLQFKEGIYALSSSLSAGKSIESAFPDALKDLAILYPDPNTYIIKEFEYIIRRLDMNETVEQALADLARRSHLEDIASFVDVFITTKRTGGNMVKVIRNTSEVISDKIRIKQEIETVISQKRLEQKVLNFIPILMILFLSWSAPDYMDMVFSTLLGRILMTITVLLLIISYFISKQIMDIEV